jgi:hypothetical protein
MTRTLLYLLFLATAASARIGETPAELQARYGKPTGTTATRTTYEKAGIRITVAMWRGRCHLILFSPMLSKEDLAKDPNALPRKFTDAEIGALLARNPADAKWEGDQGNYLTADKKFTATASSTGVMIQSIAYLHRNKQPAPPVLEGF